MVAALVVIVAAGALVAVAWRPGGSPSRAGTTEQLVHFQLRAADVRSGYRELARVTPAEGWRRRSSIERACGASSATTSSAARSSSSAASAATTSARLPALYGYEDEAHASDHIAQLRGDYLEVSATDAAPGSRHDLPVSALGEEAPPGVTFATPIPGDGTASAFTYWWRRGTVVAVVATGGTLGDFGAGESLALAHRIDDRAAA